MNNSLERTIEITIKSVDPDKIILFGSRARGNYKKDSDYDICVIKKGSSIEENLHREFTDVSMALGYLLILSLKFLSDLRS